jgi:hypothetical protein
LKVIEEKRERMLGARENSDETAKRRLKPALFVLRRERRQRRLRADHELELGDQIHEQLPVRAERFLQGVAPAAHLRGRLAEDQAHEALEGLGHGRVRDITLVLVELAGGKQPARRHEHAVKLIHDRRLADTGRAGDEHELGLAVRDDALESGEQDADLALPAVKLLGDEQAIGAITSSDRKGLDAPGCGPLRLTAPQVGGEACGGLVALLGGLREQSQDNRAELRRDVSVDRRGRARDVAVDPLHRILGRERQITRERLVQNYADRIEIAA